jgi:hypothetical protein
LCLETSIHSKGDLDALFSKDSGCFLHRLEAEFLHQASLMLTEGLSTNRPSERSLTASGAQEMLSDEIEIDHLLYLKEE